MEGKNLNIIDLEFINSEVIKRRKNIWKAYLLTTFLGFFGAHHFYLGNKILGLVKAWFGGLTIILTVVSKFSPDNVSNILSIISMIMIIVSLLWNVFDLFNIERTMSKIDKENEEEIFNSLSNQKTIIKGENHAEEQEVNN